MGVACTLHAKVQALSKGGSKGSKSAFAESISKHRAAAGTVPAEQRWKRRLSPPWEQCRPSAQLHRKGHGISQLSERICSVLHAPSSTSCGDRAALLLNLGLAWEKRLHLSVQPKVLPCVWLVPICIRAGGHEGPETLSHELRCHLQGEDIREQDTENASAWESWLREAH